MILHLSLLVSLCIFKTCMCWTLVMDQHDYCDHVYRLKNEDLIMVPLKCDQKKFSKFLKVEGLSLEFVWRLSTRWLIKQCSNFDSRAFSITISVHLVWVGAHNRRGWLQSLRKREKKRVLLISIIFTIKCTFSVPPIGENDQDRYFSRPERERERERLSSSEIKPKILHFTWYVWKWVATLDVQELYQWMLQSRVHIVVVREIHA